MHQALGAGAADGGGVKAGFLAHDAERDGGFQGRRRGDREGPAFADEHLAGDAGGAGDGDGGGRVAEADGELGGEFAGAAVRRDDGDAVEEDLRVFRVVHLDQKGGGAGQFAEGEVEGVGGGESGFAGVLDERGDLAGGIAQGEGGELAVERVGVGGGAGVVGLGLRAGFGAGEPVIAAGLGDDGGGGAEQVVEPGGGVGGVFKEAQRQKTGEEIAVGDLAAGGRADRRQVRGGGDGVGGFGVAGRQQGAGQTVLRRPEQELLGGGGGGHRGAALGNPERRGGLVGAGIVQGFGLA